MVKRGGLRMPWQMAMQIDNLPGSTSDVMREALRIGLKKMTKKRRRGQ